jgi:hypothetical protein
MVQVRQILVGSDERLVWRMNSTQQRSCVSGTTIRCTLTIYPPELAAQSALAQFRYAQLRQRGLVSRRGIDYR